MCEYHVSPEFAKIVSTGPKASRTSLCERGMWKRDKRRSLVLLATQAGKDQVGRDEAAHCTGK